MRRLTAACAAMALVLSGCSALGIGEEEATTYTVTADVEQAPNLFTGGRVSVRGVEVGEITDVEPREDFVRLTLEISSDVAIPADPTLSIVPITIIADRYVQLEPGYRSGPLLEDNDHIPLSRTVIPAELDEVLTQLQKLLSSVEPEEGEKRGPLARLIRSLDAAFAGRTNEWGGAIDKSATVLENLAQSDTEITGIIRNLDRLFFALANRSSEIGLINQRFALVAESLLQDQAHLEGTLENIAFLSDETAGLIQTSGDDLGESFRRLARVMEELLSHQEALALGIRWTNVISQALGAVDSSGKGLFAYSGRQTAPGAPGAEYNYRIDQRDTISCERLDRVVENVAVFEDATIDNVIQTLVLFIPRTYEDDIYFALRDLLLLCVDRYQSSPVTTDEPSPAQKRLLRQAAEVLGENKLKRLIARWFFNGGLE